jgi:hypothetical protein
MYQYILRCFEEPVDNLHAEDQVQYLLRLQEAACDAINDAQQVQRRSAHKKKMIAALIKEGDWVLLTRKESEKRKFDPNGQFHVKKVGTNAVALRFHSNSRAQPTVNISRVQLYFGPRQRLVTVPPDDDTGHEYDVLPVHCRPTTMMIVGWFFLLFLKVSSNVQFSISEHNMCTSTQT